jgi:hypothetical protein
MLFQSFQPKYVWSRTHDMLVVEPDYLPDSEVLCFSAVFIPHEEFTPKNYVHSSTRGSEKGGYPLCGVQGAYPPSWGFRGKRAPDECLGAASPDGGLGAKPPKEKLPCKCIL